MPRKILLKSGINLILSHKTKHKNKKGKDPTYKIKYKIPLFFPIINPYKYNLLNYTSYSTKNYLN